MSAKVVLNTKGEQIVLNDLEKHIANELQVKANALGFEVDITTLTTIIKKVSEQKFFQIAPADYMPVRVGEGAWSSNLVTYRSFLLSEEFEKGVINTGANASRLSQADAGVDSVSVPVINWAKTISWGLFDLQLAARSGNWDVVSAKEKARKKDWDLGIQRLAFLGLAGSSAVKGLLTQSDVTVNTSLIAEPLNGMTATELSTFLAAFLEAYRANCARTCWPTHFAIPESDFNGLATPSSSDFPLKSKLALIEEVLQTITMNKQFKVLPLAYGDVANSGGALSKPRYALYNSEEESVRMDIPVDYTSTLANSLDNFVFQNVGYGQFTGVKAYRPKEMLYIDNNT